MATRTTPEERRWEARAALDTLRRAEEIKRNKTLMREVKKAHAEQAKAINVVVAVPAAKPRRRK